MKPTKETLQQARQEGIEEARAEGFTEGLRFTQQKIDKQKIIDRLIKKND